VVAAIVLAAGAGMILWRRRLRVRRGRIARIFDTAIESADSAPAQVAAMSELLRRAARRRSPQADKLQGNAWLEYLDADDKRHPFTNGSGKLLLEGGFRRDANPEEVAALRVLARERFIAWMAK
jgi:hypothetical protein